MNLQDILGDFYIADMKKATVDALDASHRKVYRVLQKMIQDAEANHRDLTGDELEKYRAVEKYGGDLEEEKDSRDLKILEEPVNFKLQPYSRGNSRPETAEWRKIFGNAPLSLDGWKDRNEFYSCVFQNRFDERLRTGFETRSGFEETTGSLGGFTVPSEIASEIYSVALSDAPVYQRVRKFEMKSNELHVPGWITGNRADGVLGGVSGSWKGETQAFSEVSPEIYDVTLYAKKLGIFLSASNEVLQDSINIASAIEPMMNTSLMYSVESALINGDGVSQPLGITNSGSRLIYTRAGAGAITWPDLLGVYGKIHPQLVKGAIWLMSPTAYASICSLESTAGQLILFPNSDSTGQAPTSLLSLPVIISEHLPDLGTENDVVLVNCSAMAMGVSKWMSFERSNAYRWTEDMTSFRLVLRIAAHELMKEAITPPNSSTQLSWCVCLQ